MSYTPKPVRLVVLPAAIAIKVGETVYLNATVTDQQGRPLASSVLWSSLGTSAATVDTKGRVTGIAPGGATIVASIGELEASAEVAVT